MDRSAASILTEVFGYKAFRPGQERIIGHLIDGANVLAVMPTGAGKSLCYQIPALASDAITVVISPLVALMDDQVAALRANGVPAVSIHSGMPREDQVAAWKALRAGDSSIVYLSPERLMTERMLEALARLGVGMFVVDEAHCISKWGANFRPEYEQLSRLKERFPEARLAAFTATADKATRADIAGKLFAGPAEIIVQGFDRPNLRLAVESKESWRRQLMAFLDDKRAVSGIVYCLSRKLTEEVAAFLCEEGYSAIAYHAGQDAEVRKANQDRFMSEQAVVMVATIAFGMGIDKPDIRYVCHLNLPGSMEAYYQEIGRAGRDGLPAETLMLYGLDDIRMRRTFIDQDGEDADHKRREHKRLDALLAYCEAAECRRKALLAYFDETIEPCGNCDTCLAPPTRIEGTEQAQMVLSAIYRTGQVFGVAHVIDVLRGSENAKILERGHDDLPTYGVGKDRSKRFWQVLVRQMVAAGLVTIDIQNYGGLRITESGRDLLRGEGTFAYREVPEQKATRKRRSAPVPESTMPVDEDLLHKLKALRLDIARSRNVPAYVVFSDATLTDMAARRPSDLDSFADVSGVGPKKLKDFGDQFLSVINA
ncbi:MAG: DNA helicase RecQ [Pseudomonadota bacterium]